MRIHFGDDKTKYKNFNSKQKLRKSEKAKYSVLCN